NKDLQAFGRCLSGRGHSDHKRQRENDDSGFFSHIPSLKDFHRVQIEPIIMPSKITVKYARGRSLLPAEILTPARFSFFGGEYLARISNSINMIFTDIAGMYLPDELRSGILAGRKTRLPEKTETQRRDFLMVASPSPPSPQLMEIFFYHKRHILILSSVSEEAGERSMYGLCRTTRSGCG
ncbi:MAG: hypothetical protein Q8O91_12045, partial [Candidatus Aminicenantes bacterium]|nr:hypothetical protein [Candidatus Aminicenantes bacterium]